MDQKVPTEPVGAQRGPTPSSRGGAPTPPAWESQNSHFSSPEILRHLRNVAWLLNKNKGKTANLKHEPTRHRKGEAAGSGREHAGLGVPGHRSCRPQGGGEAEKPCPRMGG